MTTSQLGIYHSEPRQEGTVSCLGLRIPGRFRPQSALWVSSPVTNKPNLPDPKIPRSCAFSMVYREIGLQPGRKNKPNRRSRPEHSAAESNGSRSHPERRSGAPRPQSNGPRPRSEYSQTDLPRPGGGVSDLRFGSFGLVSDLDIRAPSLPRRWRRGAVSPIMPRLSTFRRIENG